MTVLGTNTSPAASTSPRTVAIPLRACSKRSILSFAYPTYLSVAEEIMTRFSRAACVVALILFGRSSAIAQAPDVTGVWHIRHSFDLTGALPSETEDVFNPLRMVNQSIVDELELPPKLQWLEPIISAYLEQ